ncbi:MAG: A/G-specific adenine glycosylase [Oscillospiraceae bacterium]|nr:A/G-specific adenine glycosylase [Oscillospiraceae bacterium]
MDDLSCLPERLLAWFSAQKRDLPWRSDHEPYHVWVSEIMLQQTRVEAVKAYYLRFMAQLPDIAALANAGDELLHKLWEGLGYYTRVRNLKKAAMQIMDCHGGQFPRDYAQILALPGIGAYTAGAISSICFDAPTPAVDGNVLRVMSRVLASRDCIDELRVKNVLRARLAALYPAGRCGDFTQALMELGACVCVPNGAPHCARCPIAALCLAHSAGQETAYPVKKQKRARKSEDKTVFLLRCGDAIAMEKRPPSGLLAGLWALPNLPEKHDAQTALDQVSAWGAHPIQLVKAVEATHIFTHIEWHMRCFEIECSEKCPQFDWPDSAARQTRYALPTAFRMFLDPMEKPT